MSGGNPNWKKGVSGNPGGKPKADYKIKELAKVHTEVALQTLADIASNGDSESARVAAAVALLDRGWGKPTQPVSGDDDMPPLTVQKIERVIVRADSETSDSAGV